MDPNENLETQERIILQIEQSTVIDDRVMLRDVLAGVRQSLLDWLSDGGRAPTWERWPVASSYWRDRTR